MSPRSRHAPLPAAQPTYPTFGSSVPRHMALPQSEMCLSSANLGSTVVNPNYTLTSSANGSRHQPSGWSSSSGSVPGVDDYSPVSGYDSMSLSGTSFPMTMIPTTCDNMDISYGVTSAAMPRYYPMDAPQLTGLSDSDMMMEDYSYMDPSSTDNFLVDQAYYGDIGSQSSPTPPPEDTFQGYTQFQGLIHRHDSFASSIEEPTVCENLGVSKLQAYNRLDCRRLRLRCRLIKWPNSTSRHNNAQPRPIRPSSERTSTRSSGSDYEDSLDSPKDDSSDRVKARNNPLYNAKPDKDGLYRCPFTKRADKCNHQPTKQKCIYS
jgi:hypothetical protein